MLSATTIRAGEGGMGELTNDCSARDCFVAALLAMTMDWPTARRTGERSVTRRQCRRKWRVALRSTRPTVRHDRGGCVLTLPLRPFDQGAGAVFAAAPNRPARRGQESGQPYPNLVDEAKAREA